MDNRKKVGVAIGALVLAGVLFWRPGCRKSDGDEQIGGPPVFICAACGKEFAEGEADVDLDEAHVGAKCPSCGEKKLFRARVCPKCGRRYVPKSIYDPATRRGDDKCPGCGTPTFTTPLKKPRGPRQPGDIDLPPPG